MRYSRQNKILELIANNEVETQDKLAQMLRDEGFEVTDGDVELGKKKCISVYCSSWCFLQLGHCPHESARSPSGWFSKCWRWLQFRYCE